MAFNAARQRIAAAANTRRLISRLPGNVLLEIFHLTLSETEVEDRPGAKLYALLQLSHVCKAWRQLASEDSPAVRRLWASRQIDILKIDERFLSLILCRSGNSLLNIICHGGRKTDRCAQHISRIRCLDIRSKCPHDFSWLAHADGSRLETLQLKCSPEDCCCKNGDPNPLSCLCNGKTPSLRRLCLQGVRLP